MKILRQGYAVRVTEEMTPTRKRGRILILDSNSTTYFDVLKEKELRQYGEDRTKRLAWTLGSDLR